MIAQGSSSYWPTKITFNLLFSVILYCIWKRFWMNVENTALASLNTCGETNVMANYLENMYYINTDFSNLYCSYTDKDNSGFNILLQAHTFLVLPQLFKIRVYVIHELFRVYFSL